MFVSSDSVIPRQFGFLARLAADMFEEVGIDLVGDAVNRLTKVGAASMDGIHVAPIPRKASNGNPS